MLQTIENHSIHILRTMAYLSMKQLVASVTGILAHRIYFVHGERDLAAARIATCHFIAFTSVLVTNWHFGGVALSNAARDSFGLSIAYLTGLFASIIVFRLFLSPLRHIKGPLRLKLTKLTHVWDMAMNQNCKLLEGLRKEYGDVVRTGESRERKKFASVTRKH